MHDTGVCPVITYFLAQDPNAGDEVTLLVLDDPGMPAGMTSSGTTCIPRELAASNTSEPAMCKVYMHMYICICIDIDIDTYLLWIYM
jgi:hypothetical protein